MALPAQAIEKIIREPSDTQGAYKQLLLLTSSIFVIMLVIYAGLAFGYKTYLTRSVKNLEDNIAKSSKSVSADDEAKVAVFYSQLMNLRTLLGEHRIVSPVFALLERTASPNVYYTKISLNGTTNELTLTGAAKGLSDIAAEASLLEQQQEVDRVNVNNGGVSTGGGPWQFTMSVFLKPEVTRGGISVSPPPSAPIATTTASSTNPTSTQR